MLQQCGSFRSSDFATGRSAPPLNHCAVSRCLLASISRPLPFTSPEECRTESHTFCLNLSSFCFLYALCYVNQPSMWLILLLRCVFEWSSSPIPPLIPPCSSSRIHIFIYIVCLLFGAPGSISTFLLALSLPLLPMWILPQIPTASQACHWCFQQTLPGFLFSEALRENNSKNLRAAVKVE